MKASEAIAILEALDPNQEVTLNIGRNFKVPKILPSVPAYTTQWVVEKEFWPKRNEITCKLH